MHTQETPPRVFQPDGAGWAPNVILELRALRSARHPGLPEARFRRALKCLLRRFGLRCERMEFAERPKP